MRKNVFGRQFKRDANERKALFKNLLTSLVLEERIKTTPAKAKAIRGAADKLVTKARKGGVAALRGLAPDINHNAVVKLINDITPRFEGRNGGYTRIIKVGNRVADNAPQVLMEWVEKPVVNLDAKTAKKEKKVKKVKVVKPKKAASNAVEKEKVKATSKVAKVDKKETKKTEKKKEVKKV